MKYEVRLSQGAGTAMGLYLLRPKFWGKLPTFLEPPRST